MKIGLISLGCPKNLVDSEVMLGLARQAGHELTQDPAAADVLVVNTCAFIDSAKKESIDAILEMAQHKKDGTCRAADRDRVPGRALPRRAARRDPRDRRRARHRRGARDRERDRHAPAPGVSSPLNFYRAGRAPAVATPAHGVTCTSRHRSRPRHAPRRLYLRRRHAARVRHAAPLRVRESRRRLRLQVRVLHHPDAARRYRSRPAAVDRAGGAQRSRRAASRSCCSSRRTRPSTASTATSAAPWPGCCAS